MQRKGDTKAELEVLCTQFFLFHSLLKLSVVLAKGAQTLLPFVFCFLVFSVFFKP